MESQERIYSRVPSVGKLVAICFWYKKGVNHVSFLHVGQKVNSDCFIENMKSEISPLHFHATYNVSSLLFPCCKVRPHVNVCITDTITKVGWGVLPQPPLSCKLAPSDFHLFVHWKGGPRRNTYTDKETLHNAMSQWLQMKESNLY
jgi:hypothetical protein